MIITKDDKTMYTFLDIVYNVFGKTADRQMLCVYQNKFYFYAGDYSGVFKRTTDGIFTERIPNQVFNVSKMPDTSFVLEKNELNLQDFDLQMIEGIKNIVDYSNLRLQLTKLDEYIISKITEETKVWLKDCDLKILTKFKSFDVRLTSVEDNNALVISSRGADEESIDETSIIFGYSINQFKMANQLTIESYEAVNSSVSAERLEEERKLDELMGEDDFDPMA